MRCNLLSFIAVTEIQSRVWLFRSGNERSVHDVPMLREFAGLDAGEDVIPSIPLPPFDNLDNFSVHSVSQKKRIYSFYTSHPNTSQQGGIHERHTTRRS